MRFATLAGLLVFVFLVAGCRASATPGVTALTAEEVLAKAREAASKVQSYRWTSDLTIHTDKGVQTARITGEWAAPDRRRMKTVGLGAGAGQVQEVIWVGERVFSSSSDWRDGAWREGRSVPPDALPRRSMIPELDNSALLNDEIVGDLAVYHVTGTSTFNSPPEGPALVSTFDLYIGKEDMLLRRQVMETDLSAFAPSAPSDEDYVPMSQTVTYDFYDYNQPVTIERPEVDASAPAMTPIPPRQ